MTCALCSRPAHWTISEVHLCPGHYGDWAEDLKHHDIGWVREKLTPEEFRARAAAQVRDWMQRRIGRTA